MFLKPHFPRLIQLYELHAVNCRCILQLAWMNEAKWETLVQTSIIQENTLRLDFCQWWHPPVLSHRLGTAGMWCHGSAISTIPGADLHTAVSARELCSALPRFRTVCPSLSLHSHRPNSCQPPCPSSSLPLCATLGCFVIPRRFLEVRRYVILFCILNLCAFLLPCKTLFCSALSSSNEVHNKDPEMSSIQSWHFGRNLSSWDAPSPAAFPQGTVTAAAKLSPLSFKSLSCISLKNAWNGKEKIKERRTVG